MKQQRQTLMMMGRKITVIMRRSLQFRSIDSSTVTENIKKFQTMPRGGGLFVREWNVCHTQPQTAQESPDKEDNDDHVRWTLRKVTILVCSKAQQSRTNSANTAMQQVPKIGRTNQKMRKLSDVGQNQSVDSSQSNIRGCRHTIGRAKM